MPVQGILFDCDGVILHTEKAYRKMVSTLLTDKYNYSISERETSKRWKKIRANTIIEDLEKEGIDNIDALKIDLNSLFDNFTTTHDIVAPNLIDVLQKINDIPKAVCSDGITLRLEKHFKDLDILDEFKFINGRDVSNTRKPDPQVYIQGADRLGVDIDQCLVIEDSPLGLKAAIDSGAITVAYLMKTDSFNELKELEPNYIINDMAELPKILEKENIYKL